jgi:replicative DNA helicase
MEPQLHVERRVLAELIANPAAVALADDLEIDDFTNFRHRVAFEALRNLQAAGCAIDILDLADSIAMQDLALGTHAAENVSVGFLGELVQNAERYQADLLEVVFSADLRLLRTIRKDRTL